MLSFEEIEDCFPDAGNISGHIVSGQWLHDFANNVAAKEREACAMVCEAEYAGLGSVWYSRIEAASACAKAIRERSGKGD
jgi:hypothetical protein